MKLSDGEKLIILMLSELYEKLDVDGEIDVSFMRSAIYNDNLWGIPWKYSGIPFDEQETPEFVSEVLDILDMWSLIEHSYERLSEKDKARLEQEAEPFGRNPQFRGFDGNNESEYLGAAMFIVDDLNRFAPFGDRSLNSHGPSIDAYRRMLPLFYEYRRNLTPDLFSVDQLVAILKEQTHPSNR